MDELNKILAQIPETCIRIDAQAFSLYSKIEIKKPGFLRAGFLNYLQHQINSCWPFWGGVLRDVFSRWVFRNDDGCGSP